MKMVVAQGIFYFVGACVIGGGLQMLTYSGAWLPVAVGIGLFFLVKDKITEWVYSHYQ
jgi:hypothetical protein